MRRSVQQSVQRGFSLIELAVVLLILAVLLSLGIGALSTMYKGRQYRVTEENIDTIRVALSNYLRNNRFLPCPDVDFAAPDGNGEDDRDGAGNCTQGYGLIPYAALGLDRDAALDGWDNFISYMVSSVPVAAAPSLNTNWTRPDQFFVGNEGGLDDATPAGAFTPAGPDNVVVALISHGPNGLGAYTTKGTRNALPAAGTDELDNTNNDTDFFDRLPTDDPAAVGGAIDDMVVSLLPNDLLSPLIRDGALKSWQAQLADQIDDIKRAALGVMANNACLTPTAGNIAAVMPSGVLPTDPWGTTYNFTQSNVGPLLGDYPILPDTEMFRITSNGPLRAVGGGDDTVIALTAAEVRGHLAGSDCTQGLSRFWDLANAEVLGRTLGLISVGTGPCSGTCPPDSNENEYNLPADNSALSTLDPWGRPLRFERQGGTSVIASNSPAANNDAYQVRSRGPDGAFGGADDLLSPMVSVGQIRGWIGKTGF